VAHVHAGIVQHEIADIDELAVEDEGAHRLGEVAARLPAGRQARRLQAGVEAQDRDRDLLQPAGDLVLSR
jgi:hypothetical protein